MTIEERAAFLGSSGTLGFRGEMRTETYAWVETTLRKYLGCVERMGEHYRVPVLGEILVQYPQTPVEGKNGSIVRKQMGYGWIAHEEEGKIQAFYRTTLNVYLTPYGKLRSLPQAGQYLRPGVTTVELERIACGHSDTEYALLVQREKARLFRSFAPRGTAP